MNTQQRIEEKLQQAFSVDHLAICDESHNHAVPPGSQSHFKVLLVSAEFAGISAVARHRKVYAVLASELSGGVHALALHTYTPQEWEEREASPASPDCLGRHRT